MPTNKKLPLSEKKQLIVLQKTNKTAFIVKLSLPLQSNGSTGTRICHSSSAEKRADSTLAENEKEVAQAQLNRTFGKRRITVLTKVDAYAYLCDSQSKGRSAKGNKEIALARLILEHAVTLAISNLPRFQY
ncbi:hypothetical protein [Paralcaligenes ureilyticus]|uniref:hypothetical protein n=1 Tax=Paralcaligenes ureilyticus TaxID=627131 RepID=UPI001046F74B|nr:hypothetical protein [Paralcaligenes ureilyticus]